MPVDIGFAFLAGLLTIAAPCILPMLPILLGASFGRRSPVRPLLIVSGFVVTFSAVSLLFSAITSLAGLSAYDLRLIAVAAIGILGLALNSSDTAEKVTTKPDTISRGRKSDL